MEIRRELLKNRGEIDYYTLWRGWKPTPHRLSLRRTDESEVYELYKRLFLEERDEIIVQGSLEECVAEGNRLARLINPDREDDTIAESIEVKMERIRRKHQSKGEDKNE